jgi:hypothetical protein
MPLQPIQRQLLLRREGILGGSNPWFPFLPPLSLFRLGYDVMSL